MNDDSLEQPSPFKSVPSVTTGNASDQPMSREWLEITVQQFANTGSLVLIKDILNADAALRAALSLKQHESQQVTAALHSDVLPADPPLSVDVEDVRQLRADIVKLSKEGMALITEKMDLRAGLVEETAIVDRVWQALGITTYKQAGGKNIDEIVTDLRAKNERLKEANEHWHTRMSFVKMDTEALTKGLEDAVAQGEWERHKRTVAEEQLRLCNVDQCNTEAALAASQQQVDDAEEAIGHWQAENERLVKVAQQHIKESGEKYTQYEQDQMELKQQLAVVKSERDTLLKWNENLGDTVTRLENQRTASEARVKELEDDIAALNAKYWEDHKYTDIKQIDELTARIIELEKDRL